MDEVGLEKVASIVADAMKYCLSLDSGDKVLVVYDGGSESVARALSLASGMIGAKTVTYNIDSENRPLSKLPAGLRELIASTRLDASFYVAGVEPGELGFRAELVGEATRSGASHVHMPRATLYILSRVEGCRETAGIVERLYNRLRGAKRIVVESEKGTRVVLETGVYRWVVDNGIIPRGDWGNWPPGEVFTTPSTATGVLVVDGVLGDYFSTKYGILEENPVIVRIEDGVVAGVEGGAIASELYAYLSRQECGLRLGELGIGGNPRIEKPIGNMLHDEKMPGAHIAAGDPLGARTGAEWKCSVHVDMLPLKTTVRAGTVTIIDRGAIVV